MFSIVVQEKKKIWEGRHESIAAEMVSNKNSANLTITIDIQTTARKKKGPLRV